MKLAEGEVIDNHCGGKLGLRGPWKAGFPQTTPLLTQIEPALAARNSKYWRSRPRRGHASGEEELVFELACDSRGSLIPHSELTSPSQVFPGRTRMDLILPSFFCTL